MRNIFNGRGIWSMDEEEIAEIGQKMVDLRHSRKCENVGYNLILFCVFCIICLY